MRRVLYLAWVAGVLGLGLGSFLLGTMGIVAGSGVLGELAVLWGALAAVLGIVWVLVVPVCEVKPPAPLPSRAGRQQMRRERRMRELEQRVRERERVTRLKELAAGLGGGDDE